MLEENITIEGIIEELILYHNSGFIPFPNTYTIIITGIGFVTSTHIEVQYIPILDGMCEWGDNNRL